MDRRDPPDIPAAPVAGAPTRFRRDACIIRGSRWLVRASGLAYAAVLVYHLPALSRGSVDALFWVVEVGLSVAAALSVLRSARMAAARRLVGAADVEALGPLLQEAVAAGLSGEPELTDTLVPLLDGMQPHHYAALSRAQRDALHSVLAWSERLYGYPAYRRDLPLKLAVLAALEQAGDERSIPVLVSASESARDPEVRQAAGQCLLFLRQRLNRQRLEAPTLLRPASVPAGGTLLRPSSPEVEADPAALLRPAGDAAPGPTSDLPNTSTR